MELNANRDEFKKLGLGVAAISYDSVAVLHHFAERKNIAIPLLSDPKSAIIRRVGLLNETISPDTPYFGVPYPGVFVLDAQGRVKAKYFEDDVRRRYTSADVLVHLFGFRPEAARGQSAGRQMKVTSWASNAAVSPGQRIALVLDIALPPGMHVYAPGAGGYIPIAWTIAPSSNCLVHPVEMPAPKTLYLEAIDEKAPVYEGEFRLTRDVTIGSGASGEMTIEGTLKYQACDDRMCYIPDTVPLKWTLQMETADPGRVPPALRKKQTAY